MYALHVLWTDNFHERIMKMVEKWAGWGKEVARRAGWAKRGAGGCPFETLKLGHWYWPIRNDLLSLLNHLVSSTNSVNSLLPLSRSCTLQESFMLLHFKVQKGWVNKLFMTCYKQESLFVTVLILENKVTHLLYFDRTIISFYLEGMHWIFDRYGHFLHYSKFALWKD